MYVLVFYVPSTHVEEVKQALFAAGAGSIPPYSECSWQVAGKGQFRPMEGSDPFLGIEGKVEYVDEFRVEMVVEKSHIDSVVGALLATHPYEVPAYHLIPALTLEKSGTT